MEQLPISAWGIIFSVMLSVIIFLAGLNYKTLNSRFAHIEKMQKCNEERHHKFVAALLTLMIELHPERADLITKSFRELLQ